MTNEQRVKEVYPKAEMMRVPQPMDGQRSRVYIPLSGWHAGDIWGQMDGESAAWADAASRLPKAAAGHEFVWRADSEQCSVCGENHHGCIIVKKPSVSPVEEGETAPQTFEEWWKEYSPIRTMGEDNYLQCAYAAWNAAKASSPIDCHAPDYEVGGDHGTQQKTSDSEARNTAAGGENLSSLPAERSDVENIRQSPDSTDDRRQRMSVLPVSASSPAVAGGESEIGKESK